MRTTIKMDLSFTSEAEPRSFTDSLIHERDSSDEGKTNLALLLFAELRKEVFFSECLANLPSVRDLLQSPAGGRRSGDPLAFIDLFNVPGLWLEIDNTFTDLRNLLAQAKTYKDLEPHDSSPVSDSLCAYLHFEKMYRLDLAVFQIVKIQDLAVRLLHENFSGHLISVHYDEEGWEKDLRLSDAKKGLKRLAENGELGQADCQAILAALDTPSKSTHQGTLVKYRNRIAHGIRPSVDYPELYTHLQDRAGKVIKDPSGNERARVYSIGADRTRPDFLFVDLFIALSDYMKHVAEMLHALKRIPILS
jgi:hypothetical protein